MRTLVATLLALALVAFLPAPATAQQSGSLVIVVQPPEAPLTDDGPLVYTGYATLTADWTAAVSSPSGIPVAYSLQNVPGFAAAAITPANDVFPAPAGGGAAFSYSVTRAFTIVVTAAGPQEHDMTGVLAMAAVTTPGHLGQAFYGRAETFVSYLASEKPCDDHVITEAQLAEWAEKAANAYNEYEASRSGSQADEVTTQSTNASPIPLPWAVVGVCAIVGAGVGLVLRRRLKR